MDTIMAHKVITARVQAHIWRPCTGCPAWTWASIPSSTVLEDNKRFQSHLALNGSLFGHLCPSSLSLLNLHEGPLAPGQIGPEGRYHAIAHSLYRYDIFLCPSNKSSSLLLLPFSWSWTAGFTPPAFKRG
jgi:hypothetical protein